MYTYDTVTEAISDLKKRGFTRDFNLQTNCLVCSQTQQSLFPDDFEIVETYRFEGDTDPSDEAVLYAISAKEGANGILVNAYGVYADSVSADMVKKLSI